MSRHKKYQRKARVMISQTKYSPGNINHTAIIDSLAGKEEKDQRGDKVRGQNILQTSLIKLPVTEHSDKDARYSEPAQTSNLNLLDQSLSEQDRQAGKTNAVVQKAKKGKKSPKKQKAWKKPAMDEYIDQSGQLWHLNLKYGGQYKGNQVYHVTKDGFRIHYYFYKDSGEYIGVGGHIVEQRKKKPTDKTWDELPGDVQNWAMTKI